MIGEDIRAQHIGRRPAHEAVHVGELDNGADEDVLLAISSDRLVELAVDI